MLNRVVLIGRLVADPELRYTGSGVPVANFRIAVDRRFTTSSGERETDFINIVAWRQSAEFAANYLGKGRLVAIDGRLQIRQWTTQDGQRRQTAEVVADSIQGLDRPPQTGEQVPEEMADSASEAGDSADEDVPGPWADE